MSARATGIGKRLAAAAALVILAGCGASRDGANVPLCPRVAIVADAGRLVQAAPGGGGSAFEARLFQVGGECIYPRDRSRVTVELTLQIAFQRGSSGAATRPDVGYFVAVVDGDGVVLGRQEFRVQADLTSRQQVVLVEDLEQRISLADGRPAVSYEVLVGFLLSREQLDLNRASPR